MNIAIIFVNTTIKIAVITIFVYTLLRFFLGINHPLVNFIGQAIEPLLSPIQKRVPPMGGLDFSPLILMIGLQLLGKILVALLRSIN